VLNADPPGDCLVHSVFEAADSSARACLFGLWAGAWTWSPNAVTGAGAASCAWLWQRAGTMWLAS